MRPRAKCGIMRGIIRLTRKRMNTIQFEWTPELSVGDDELDAQHKRLLHQVNILLEAIFQKESPEVVTDALGFCDEYISEHFTAEEQYLRDHGYPHMEEHVALHDGFRRRYAEMKEKLKIEGASENLLHELENDLARWFIVHIGTEDKKYAAHISAASQEA